jgi:mannobiose 2-epimerase
MGFTEELSEYRQRFYQELTEDILPFWTQHIIDADRGGFHGALDLQGRPDPTAPKGCVLYTRLLWTFSAAARFLKDGRLEKLAHQAYQLINSHFLDVQHGGFFMELDADFTPTNTIKHTYAQAFALYSLCEYYRLTQSPQILQQIQSLFAFLEEKTKDPDGPGYLEGFTRDWKALGENRMADGNEPKSMNTHLHVLEAYSAVVRAWNDPVPQRRLRELLELFTRYIIRPDGHFGLFFEKDFSESDASRAICSFGHEIEGSWLLWEAAHCLKDDELMKALRPVVLQIVDTVERVGLDKDGGMFLESVRFGSHVRTNKHWWIQAETLVGFINAFQLTGHLRYWENVRLSWSFIDNYVIDHTYGEWYAKVSRLGVPFLEEPANDPSPYYRNDRKADLWKCPYHNSRCCMEMIRRIDEVSKRADC